MAKFCHRLKLIGWSRSRYDSVNRFFVHRGNGTRPAQAVRSTYMQRFPSYFDAFAVYICWNFGYTRARVDRPSATRIREIFIRPFCLRIPFSSLQANRIECLRPAVTIEIKYAAKYRWNRRDVVARISASSRRSPNESAAKNSANRSKDSTQQNRYGYTCLASQRTFFLPVLIIPTKVKKPKLYRRIARTTAIFSH